MKSGDAMNRVSTDSGSISICRDKKRSVEKSTLLAVRAGLEPATPCVTGRYSNQLN